LPFGQPLSLWRAAMLLGAVLALAPTTSAEGSGQVWLISTRRVPVWDGPAWTSESLDYWRLGSAGQWIATDRRAFLGETGQDPMPTTVFVHGNLADADTAVRRAWTIYRRMVCQAAGRPFRLVIWSWPSQRVCKRLRPDAQLKAEYSDYQGCYLADLLAHLDRRVSVSLVGYSYGARVITAALHLLGGGGVEGCAIAGTTVSERAARPHTLMRVVLVAAAMDADWILPGHRHGLALTQVDQVLITRNCADRAMRWYARLYGRRGPRALGYAGPVACRGVGAEGVKVEMVDVTCAVGKVHDWQNYMSAPGLDRRLAWYTFLAEGGRSSR